MKPPTFQFLWIIIFKVVDDFFSRAVQYVFTDKNTCVDDDTAMDTQLPPAKRDQIGQDVTLKNAVLWGLGIYRIATVESWLRKNLRNLGLMSSSAGGGPLSAKDQDTALSGASRKFSSRPSNTFVFSSRVEKVSSSTKINAEKPRIKLNGAFIKFEDVSGEFRPFSHEMTNWPVLRLDKLTLGTSATNASPFAPAESIVPSIQPGPRLFSVAKTKQQNKQNAMRGYCEACGVVVADIDRHLQGDDHARRIRKAAMGTVTKKTGKVDDQKESKTSSKMRQSDDSFTKSLAALDNVIKQNFGPSSAIRNGLLESYLERAAGLTHDGDDQPNLNVSNWSQSSNDVDEASEDDEIMAPRVKRTALIEEVEENIENRKLEVVEEQPKEEEKMLNEQIKSPLKEMQQVAQNSPVIISKTATRVVAMEQDIVVEDFKFVENTPYNDEVKALETVVQKIAMDPTIEPVNEKQGLNQPYMEPKVENHRSEQPPVEDDWGDSTAKVTVELKTEPKKTRRLLPTLSLAGTTSALAQQLEQLATSASPQVTSLNIKARLGEGYYTETSFQSSSSSLSASLSECSTVKKKPSKKSSSTTKKKTAKEKDLESTTTKTPKTSKPRTNSKKKIQTPLVPIAPAPVVQDRFCKASNMPMEGSLYSSQPGTIPVSNQSQYPNAVNYQPNQQLLFPTISASFHPAAPVGYQFQQTQAFVWPIGQFQAQTQQQLQPAFSTQFQPQYNQYMNPQQQQQQLQQQSQQQEAHFYQHHHHQQQQQQQQQQNQYPFQN